MSEFLRASEFYRQRRDRDGELLAVRARAALLIQKWTGQDSRDVGSFGLRLNLETSDLDLGIGYPVERREELIALLAPNTVFKGERVTRFPAADLRGSEPATTTRLVFAFEVDGVEVDLSALTEEDFAVACRMLDDIDGEHDRAGADRTHLGQVSAAQLGSDGGVRAVEVGDLCQILPGVHLGADPRAVLTPVGGTSTCLVGLRHPLVGQVPQGSAALINCQELVLAQRVYSPDSSSASVPCKTGVISITVPAMRARSRVRKAFNP